MENTVLFIQWAQQTQHHLRVQGSTSRRAGSRYARPFDLQCSQTDRVSDAGVKMGGSGLVLQRTYCSHFTLSIYISELQTVHFTSRALFDDVQGFSCRIVVSDGTVLSVVLCACLAVILPGPGYPHDGAAPRRALLTRCTRRSLLPLRE